MHETSQNRSLNVFTSHGADPHMWLPVSELVRVTSVLDANQVSYSLDEEALSIDGQPEVIYLQFGPRTDAAKVQRLLDSTF